MFSGLIDLPWWGYVVVALAVTHITIAAVTIFLHRHQAHRALELHPIPSHFFRFWLWFTTGMITKEWAAVHRKHHAHCETEEDPHSPQIVGINRVLWGGVMLYRKASLDPECLSKFGHGTPDDWLERNIYTPHNVIGISILAVLNIALFGVVPGVLIWITQMLWIPFWAAGVINGVGHFFGYRNFASADASRNILPWGILIGGEELHNNHHAYGTSAKLSSKWYEFDIGWMYIRILETFGLARVKKVAPRVRLNLGKRHCDEETLQAVLTHRYEVMAKYAQSLKSTVGSELAKLKAHAAHANMPHLNLLTHRWLHADADALASPDKAELDKVMTSSKVLKTVYSMRQELASIWARSTLTQEQLVKSLNDWCHRAEASGIDALQKFSRRLRCYA